MKIKWMSKEEFRKLYPPIRKEKVMRTKHEILEDSHKDITNERYRDTAHLWLEYHEIEVLLDIRDILKDIEIKQNP